MGNKTQEHWQRRGPAPRRLLPVSALRPGSACACRHLPGFADLSFCLGSSVRQPSPLVAFLLVTGYLRMMSKKKPLSPPENLWLRPPPPQFLSFISSSVLPTTTSSFNPTELLGDVWVGMDTRLWRGRGEVQHHGQRHTAGSIQATRAGWVALNAHSGSHVQGAGLGG